MSAPLQPEADKERLVISYSGMQVFDVRESIRIVLGINPPRGIRGSLRIEGFTENRKGVWEAPLNPRNIMSAQVIGNIYFAKETP